MSPGVLLPFLKDFRSSGDKNQPGTMILGEGEGDERESVGAATEVGADS